MKNNAKQEVTSDPNTNIVQYRVSNPGQETLIINDFNKVIVIFSLNRIDFITYRAKHERFGSWQMYINRELMRVLRVSLPTIPFIEVSLPIDGSCINIF